MLSCCPYGYASAHNNVTEAPDVDDDDNASHHDGICTAEDDFDASAFTPTCHPDGIPAMPTVTSQGGHREHNPPFTAPFNAAVARAVGRKEMMSTPDALAACKK